MAYIPPVRVVVSTVMPRPDFGRWLLGQGVSRPVVGACPCCGAPENAWCDTGCLLIDLADVR